MKERLAVKNLLQACLTLIEVWDAGEAVNEVDWELLADAVEQASDAVADYVEAHPS